MRLQKMLSTVVALLLFVGGASAHEGSDQLTDTQRGLLGGGASLCFVVAGVLGYFLWRKLKTYSSRNAVQPTSARLKQSSSGKVPPLDLARLHDSVLVAKKRLQGKAAEESSAAGGILSDVERGIRAHYDSPLAAASLNSAADSAGCSTGGSTPKERVPMVAINGLIEDDRAQLRAANIMDSVLIMRSRNDKRQTAELIGQGTPESDAAATAQLQDCAGAGLDEYSALMPGQINGIADDAQGSEAHTDGPGLPSRHVQFGRVTKDMAEGEV